MDLKCRKLNQIPLLSLCSKLYSCPKCTKRFEAPRISRKVRLPNFTQRHRTPRQKSDFALKFYCGQAERKHFYPGESGTSAIHSIESRSFFLSSRTFRALSIASSSLSLFSSESPASIARPMIKVSVSFLSSLVRGQTEIAPM